MSQNFWAGASSTLDHETQSTPRLYPQPNQDLPRLLAPMDANHQGLPTLPRTLAVICPGTCVIILVETNSTTEVGTMGLAIKHVQWSLV